MLLTSEHGVSACAAGFASGADVCGGEWEETPWPHFSGNMWTATCSYIASLPPPSSLLPITHSNWGSMEAWIGSGVDVSVWHLGSAYTGHKYIQMPRYNSSGILGNSVRVSTCVRPAPRSCRPDINLMHHEFHLTSKLLKVTVGVPCACILHVTKDEVNVTFMTGLDTSGEVYQAGTDVIPVDREVVRGHSAICSFSRSWPLNLKGLTRNVATLTVVVWVRYDFGTHHAVATDARQVIEF